MPSVTLSAKNNTAWLPVRDISDTESDQDSLFDHELPTFDEAVNTSTFISPRLTIEASSDLTILGMTVKLTQKIGEAKSTLLQWNITSVKNRLPQPSSADQKLENFRVTQGKHYIELTGFLDSNLPESVENCKKQPVSKIRLLGQKKPTGEPKKLPSEYSTYRLEVNWSKKKHLHPLGKPVDHEFAIPFYFRREHVERMPTPIVLSSIWAQKAETTYVYASKYVAFDDDIVANITVCPLTKHLRLTSVHFSVKENGGDHVRVHNVYCQHHMTPEQLEQHEYEIKEIEENGYEYQQHFLDTCCKGNLLTLGADHTDLTYRFSLRKVTEYLNPTTRYNHPTPTTHTLVSTLRFSVLETIGKTKKRRFFDHNISTPVTIFHRESSLRGPDSRRVAAPLPEKQALPAYEE
ncbi:hypothetical protein CJU89_4105 [Yarrowia sp. B02]|nr:hypothetical protein CJU89_4105 [Yarrowia sp. B02]